jgi:hypothetical protein
MFTTSTQEKKTSEMVFHPNRSETQVGLRGGLDFRLRSSFNALDSHQFSMLMTESLSSTGPKVASLALERENLSLRFIQHSQLVLLCARTGILLSSLTRIHSLVAFQRLQWK